jgi:formate-dependent nitrite reductase membrane component NrfD
MKSYYGLPILKKPVWTWEVPVYFFVGGAAGASAMIGLAAQLRGAEKRLVRDARLIAAIGAGLSAPLLISDLGRPERFLNMLRVFKPQSPMSVGVWILSAFGAGSMGAVILPRRIGDAFSALSAAAGLGMATYTGVLIGATSIPVWAKHHATLPIHFGASATASAASILELRGHRTPALNALALGAALVETAMGARIELTMDRESEPLRTPLVRIGGVLSGPLPSLLRLVAGRSKKTRRLAAASAIAGSLITRLAWMAAGRASVGDHASARNQVGERSATRQPGEKKSQPHGE